MIYITKSVVKETRDKVDHLAIQELVDQLDLSKYTSQVKNLVFMYIAISSPNHPEHLEFESDDDTLGIRLKLDYDKFLEASDSEAIDMMKNLFLEGIDRYKDLDVEFDIQQFKADVQNLFFPQAVEENA